MFAGCSCWTSQLVQIFWPHCRFQFIVRAANLQHSREKAAPPCSVRRRSQEEGGEIQSIQQKWVKNMIAHTHTHPCSHTHTRSHTHTPAHAAAYMRLHSSNSILSTETVIQSEVRRTWSLPLPPLSWRQRLMFSAQILKGDVSCRGFQTQNSDWSELLTHDEEDDEDSPSAVT